MEMCWQMKQGPGTWKMKRCWQSSNCQESGAYAHTEAKTWKLQKWKCVDKVVIAKNLVITHILKQGPGTCKMKRCWQSSNCQKSGAYAHPEAKTWNWQKWKCLDKVVIAKNLVITHTLKQGPGTCKMKSCWQSSNCQESGAYVHPEAKNWNLQKWKCVDKVVIVKNLVDQTMWYRDSGRLLSK